VPLESAVLIFKVTPHQLVRCRQPLSPVPLLFDFHLFTLLSLNFNRSFLVRLLGLESDLQFLQKIERFV
jgi:hypothetical protein